MVSVYFCHIVHVVERCISWLVGYKWWLPACLACYKWNWNQIGVFAKQCMLSTSALL